MKNIIDQIPEEFRSTFIEVLAKNNKTLLDSFVLKEEPTLHEIEEIEDIFSTEFVNNLGPDDEPTQKGKLIDNTLGAFLRVWTWD